MPACSAHRLEEGDATRCAVGIELVLPRETLVRQLSQSGQAAEEHNGSHTAARPASLRNKQVSLQQLAQASLPSPNHLSGWAAPRAPHHRGHKHLDDRHPAGAVHCCP